MGASRTGPGDFFDRQDYARRMTVRLSLLFGLVFLFLCVGTYVGLLLVVDVVGMFSYMGPILLVEPLLSEEIPLEFHPQVAVLAVVLTAALVATGSLLRFRSLRGGGPAVAEAIGGIEVDGAAEDPRVRRYVNVVEEMALASGVPVPRIYVLKHQPGINAFAAGYDMNDAAVAVTEGALKELSRDELQAVVAHEFSHILNGDMRLNIRLLALLAGVMSIFLVGRTLMEASGEHVGSLQRTAREEVGSGVAFLMWVPGLALAITGFAGVIGSRLIKAGISRQREFLADASAIQFTRNPEALGRALQKIGGYEHGSALRGAGAEEVSHMCFGEASSSWLTHPALEERVMAVDPSFNPDMGFLVLEASAAEEIKVRDPLLDMYPGPGEQGVADVMSSIGQASAAGLLFCATLLERIPEPISEARSSLSGSVATTYLLLLHEEKEQRKKQAAIITEKAAPEVAREAQKLWPAVRRLDDELRLPLLDLLVPVLRRMNREQFDEFVAVCEELIHIDGEVDFREFLLEQVVVHRLRRAFNKEGGRAAQYHSFGGMQPDLQKVLSTVAYLGADAEDGAKEAFRVGKMALPPVVDQVEYLPRDRWTFDQVGDALERFSLSSPAIKRSLVEACAATIMADDEVVLAEAEILRAICEVLDVPLPPFVPVGVVKAATKEPELEVD